MILFSENVKKPKRGKTYFDNLFIQIRRKSIRRAGWQQLIKVKGKAIPVPGHEGP
jgi:hypothetical protein